MEMKKYLTATTTLILKKGDITKIKADAVVNAANSSLRGGGGVDGAIHKVGGSKILEECIARYPDGCPTGECRITTGGELPANYVIHCVGPVYNGTERDKEMLQSCYIQALKIATNNELNSIAFPSISTGAYGYPITEAAKIAIDTVTRFIAEKDSSIEIIYFVPFSEEDYEVYEEYLRTN